jgi:hypothetical protein
VKFPPDGFVIVTGVVVVTGAISAVVVPPPHAEINVKKVKTVLSIKTCFIIVLF